VWYQSRADDYLLTAEGIRQGQQHEIDKRQIASGLEATQRDIKTAGDGSTGYFGPTSTRSQSNPCSLAIVALESHLTIAKHEPRLCYKHLLLTMAGPTSSYSAFVTHML
jgi:hypothetical protein